MRYQLKGNPTSVLAEMLNLYLKIVLWLAVHNNYVDNCAMPMIFTTGSNVPSYLLLLKLNHR